MLTLENTYKLHKVCFYLRVFYQTIRDVLPGQELLVHYGKQYAKYLDIWKEYNFSLVTMLSVLLPCYLKTVTVE